MVFKNKINPNLYRFSSEEEKTKHQQSMDDIGFEIYREYETKTSSGRTIYYCEYKEIGRA